MFRLVVLPVFAFVFRRMNHPNKISFVRSTSSSSAVGTILSCTNNNNRMVQPTILTDTLSSSSSSLASDERDNNSPPKLDHTIIINDSYHGNYSNNNNRLQVERCTSAQLRRAAGSQSLSVLQQALQGWTVEEIDNIASEEVGKNPVHIAAWQGCMENLQYLIEFMGCNVNRIAEGKYCYGKTPLFFALTRSREEIIDYLLQNGAYVKIVNNKGQSVLSIAASHVSDPIIQQIQYQETKCTQEWMNYRMTHSDSLEYGDLDPRFMDRPLRATDIVTALVINPTTKQTRKGGFLRRNPEIATREAFNRNEKLMLQKMKQQQAQSTTSSLSLADEDALREAWESLEQCFERSDDTISSLTYIQQIILINDQQQQMWIPDTAEKLRETYQRTDIELSDWLKEIAAVAAEPCSLWKNRESVLLEKLIVQVADPNVYRQRRISSKSSSSRHHHQQAPPPKLSDDGWKDACELLIPNQLHICRLEQPDCPILTLPNRSIVVDTVHSLTGLLNDIKTKTLIAIDTEWTNTDDVATIQIAFDDKAFVIDLLSTSHYTTDSDTTTNNYYMQLCRDFIKSLFHDTDKIILGFAISNDIPKLEEYVGESLTTSASTEEDGGGCRILDYQKLYCDWSQMPGLASCVKEYSSIPLSKEQQCSNWSQRPLSQPQIDYAALDAAILLYLLSEKYNQPEACNDDVM